ncbi:MAG TPA: cysteine desulfurase family protein [Bdellovibrionota bacterium]|nr:cysteine desulfurase family protein [Bdellovibrionota bacterium]
MKPIYLDYHATTPCDPRVVDKMSPYFSERFGNASSGHIYGQEASKAVEEAREQVASLIGASPREIIFTSGATESNNMAIFGIARAYRDRGNHIVTSPTEHRSVLDPCKALQRDGFDVTFVKVDRHGRVDPEEVRRAITDQTILISLMFVNNEIGTLHPIAEIGKIAQEKRVIFHCDAVQAAGKVPVGLKSTAIDLLSLSAHKMYGPKGAGALFLRQKSPRIRIPSMMLGAGQEKGLRSGTINVSGIVGFGEACALTKKEFEGEVTRLRALRDRLKDGIFANLDGVTLNGHPTERAPNNLHLSFGGIDGRVLLESLVDVAVSAGAACTSTSVEPSHVLKAIGVNDELAAASLRFSVGRFTIEGEIDRAVEIVCRTVKALRAKNLAARTAA